MVEGDSHGLLRHLLRLAAQVEALDCLLPTNKKAMAIARATGFRGLGLVHPFGNRNSQKAAPRLQTAWPLVCSYTCWALSWASSSCAWHQSCGPYPALAV